MKLSQFPLDGSGGFFAAEGSYETDPYDGQFPLDGSG